MLGPWLARCALRRQPGRRNQRASILSVAYHAFKVPWYDALPSRPARACLVLMIWAQYQSGLTRLQWLGCEASSLWVCLVAMLHGVRALAPAPHHEADYILPLRAQLARPTTSSEVLACTPPHPPAPASMTLLCDRPTPHTRVPFSYIFTRASGDQVLQHLRVAWLLRVCVRRCAVSLDVFLRRTRVRF